jgi:hypothetical protein
MSAADRGASTTSASPTLAVPARARALGARLAGLFETDQEIVRGLAAAQHLLAGSNDRLWSDPAADPLSVHHQIHRAFCAYRQASEQRRQLAVDVGELSQQLTDALTAAGYHPQQARKANVHELAAGTWRPTEGKENDR